MSNTLERVPHGPNELSDLLSVPIDESLVVSSGIPVNITTDALLDTSLDVLINAPPDVLTNGLVDVSATAFPDARYYAPLNLRSG